MRSLLIQVSIDPTSPVANQVILIGKPFASLTNSTSGIFQFTSLSFTSNYLFLSAPLVISLVSGGPKLQLFANVIINECAIGQQVVAAIDSNNILRYQCQGIIIIYFITLCKNTFSNLYI